jgi:hypothetical protein
LDTATETTSAAPVAEAPVAAPAPAAAAPETPQEKPPTQDWVKIRAAEERNRREREELKARAKEAEEARKFQEEVRRLAKEDPAKAAEMVGIDYREWTQRRIRGAKADPAAEVRSEVEKLRSEMRAKEEAAQKARQEEEQLAIEQHWAIVSQTFAEHVKTAGADREFLRAELESDPDTVHATLREMAAQSPDLTIEQAAALYEQHLAARFQRYAATQKARALIQPSAQPAETKPSTSTPEAENGTAGGSNGAVTLTNGHAQERSTGPASAVSSSNKSRVRSDREADEDRLRRALALIG